MRMRIGCLAEKGGAIIALYPTYVGYFGYPHRSASPKISARPTLLDIDIGHGGHGHNGHGHGGHGHYGHGYGGHGHGGHRHGGHGHGGDGKVNWSIIESCQIHMI